MPCVSLGAFETEDERILPNLEGNALAMGVAAVQEGEAGAGAGAAVLVL